MPKNGTDKKSPEQQADERALSQLRQKHAAEFDELKEQERLKQKEKQQKGGKGGQAA